MAISLKERFRKLNLSTWINTQDTVKLEELADEHAIEFSQWLDLNWSNTLTKRELLNNYKKDNDRNNNEKVFRS
jgi:hypothetical protein